MQLDEVHGRHGESGTVHHAVDVPVVRYVVQIVLAGTPLHRVFLARIAESCEIALAKERVGIDVDLGVECHERAARGDDERVHLDQAQVLIHVEPVERCRERLELRHLRAAQPQAEGELARLVGL